jgi:ornithine carbamoyltransferase
MPYSIPTSRSWSLAALPSGERQRVVELAASLAEASRSGQALQPLRGKNLAVLCEEPARRGLDGICRAANALGARVTHIRPSEALSAAPHGTQAVGSVLGRLYDAIDCYGVSAEVIDRLIETTGRPVFNALGEQPTAPVPDARADATAAARADEFTLQALLVSALTWH